ncbi:MucR family transcriptional regulator [Aureimonas pseudogalii]|uniref:Putative transcriptional regulator n=1 Tax=Aureimonas pseudogalii TaxID=1744844 RepID=A0A7W6H8L3_9HYPH|nr:MucR family transcriptional regulator [Aureimonas pseudogalii]MBB4000625.1 putative transcriptional regulator [Aureimonas pseudogalii]
MRSQTAETVEILEQTAEITAAYVSNNHLPREEIAGLIAVIHATLGTLGQQPEAVPVPDEPLVPAVPIRKSVTPDYLICLEDGKSFKSLKRHLMTHYDLTPEAYRRKWGLPADYPMVATNYAARRSELARSLGLGRKARPVEDGSTDEG